MTFEKWNSALLSSGSKIGARLWVLLQPMDMVAYLLSHLLAMDQQPGAQLQHLLDSSSVSPIPLPDVGLAQELANYTLML